MLSGMNQMMCLTRFPDQVLLQVKAVVPDRLQQGRHRRALAAWVAQQRKEVRLLLHVMHV